MTRKIAIFLIVALLTAMLSGCSGMFVDTYHSEKPFQGNEGIDLDSNVQVVQNYAELRRQVFNLMNNHGASLDLLLSGYTGNVVSDIASVCNAVKTESAYGAYCVDYVSYDLRQIVSHYEAKINISYKYTQEELESLQTTSDMDSFCMIVASHLEQETPTALIRVNNGVTDESAVKEMIAQTIRNHPMSISYEPKVSLKVYSGNSSQKIYEVNVQYDESVDNKKRLDDMGAELNKIAQGITEDAPEQLVLASAEFLAGHCAMSAESRTSAYDALIGKAAGSEGVACAYKAICDKLGVECTVVSGKVDKMEHYWNIVKVADAYYHVDVSVLEEEGGVNALFQSDAQKQVGYWWNQAEYPDCDGELSYTDVFLNKVVEK